MMSARPPEAAAGRPPPMTLPTVYRAPGTPSVPDQPHLLHRRARGDLLGQQDLALGGRAVRGAAPGGLAYGLDDRGVRVAEDHRAPGADEVDVLVAVRVEQVGAAGGGDEPRGAAD